LLINNKSQKNIGTFEDRLNLPICFNYSQFLLYINLNILLIFC